MDTALNTPPEPTAEFGAELVLQQRYFRHAFIGGVDEGAGGVVIHVADAIEGEGIVFGTLAGDGRARALAYAALRGDAGANQAQVPDAGAARGGRQFNGLARLERGLHLGSSGIDRRRRRADLDAGGGGSHFQREIRCNHVAQHDVKPLDAGGSEPLGRCRYGVIADRQIAETVDAFGVGGSRGGDARCFIVRSYGCGGNRAAAPVCHGARDVAADGLTE